MIRSSLESRDKAFYYIYHQSGWLEHAFRMLSKESNNTNIKEAIQEALIVLDNHIRNFNYKENQSLKYYFFRT